MTAVNVFLRDWFSENISYRRIVTLGTLIATREVSIDRLVPPSSAEGSSCPSFRRYSPGTEARQRRSFVMVSDGNEDAWYNATRSASIAWRGGGEF